MRRQFIAGALLVSVGLVLLLVFHWGWHTWLLAGVLLPLMVLGAVDLFHPSDNIRRQYPLLGRVSRFVEAQRHVAQEAVLQPDTEGSPFSRLQRDIVQKRAEEADQSFPFGTQLSYVEPGRAWWAHSAFPLDIEDNDLRVTVGGPRCAVPYSASVLNIGGMSFGSISGRAVQALNGGAALGNFAHNTGEGGLTPYHEAPGGDLIFQFGTGYFGCRTDAGDFDPETFAEVASRPQVKMVEIKISQGAKPGFGAILPAAKNTEEISRYRGVPAHQTIHSPPHHRAFRDPVGLMRFIARLRELSGGKPIGIKLCVGRPEEVGAIVAAAAESGDGPDYIAIDGGEGGTGAGHVEAMHWVGMPLDLALPVTARAIRDAGLREHLRIFASGRLVTAFDLLRARALGADAVYSARGMMFALGCVQSLKCNRNTCPTGITTMDPSRVGALVVGDKRLKVANYHRNTLKGVRQLLNAAGLPDLSSVTPDHIRTRTGLPLL